MADHARALADALRDIVEFYDIGEVDVPPDSLHGAALSALAVYDAHLAEQPLVDCGDNPSVYTAPKSNRETIAHPAGAVIGHIDNGKTNLPSAFAGALRPTEAATRENSDYVAALMRLRKQGFFSGSGDGFKKAGEELRALDFAIATLSTHQQQGARND